MALEDAIDPDEFYAEADRRARARRERRPARSRVQRPVRLRPPAGLDEARHLAQSPAGRVLVGTVAGIALLTVVGLIALWPGAVHHHGPSQTFGGPTQVASVQRTYDVPCPGPVKQTCRQILVRVDSRSSRITLGPVGTVPKVARGDDVRVSKTVLRPGVTPPPGYEGYQFVGVERGDPLFLLACAVGLLALVLLRWRGLLAVIGVGLSLLLLVAFIVPAILTGEPALLVALVGALAVMFVTLVLTSGVGAQTLAAALGITVTLVLACLLGLLCVDLVRLDGQAGDASLVLSQQNRSLSLEGVVIAGIVIGALGVLADTAVTQASAVMALRRASPELGPRALYRSAIGVGRDHLSATIHTLVLAYAGASLPLLLALRATGVSFGDAINAQDLAEPIVATLVGCVALIAAVPLTTGLAATLVARVPREALPDGHGHSHP